MERTAHSVQRAGCGVAGGSDHPGARTEHQPAEDCRAGPAGAVRPTTYDLR